MSIYVMTVGDLAKKRGEPVGDFVKKIQQLGFEAGSHAKKLTQTDLDNLIVLLNGSDPKPLDPKPVEPHPIEKKILNPNVLLLNIPDGKFTVLSVDATLKDNKVDVDIIEQTIEPTIGEALLEFRKQMGLRMGVN